MTLTKAQFIADDVQMGNVHLYSYAELLQAETALWGASRVDYNRLDALDIAKSAHMDAVAQRLRTR